jgi:hypothetical protein
MGQQYVCPLVVMVRVRELSVENLIQMKFALKYRQSNNTFNFIAQFLEKGL